MNNINEKVFSINIIRDSEIPIYKQLAVSIDEICSLLKPGSKLPSLRKIAKALSVSYLTVTKSIDLCISQGLLKGVKGRGIFITEEKDIKLPILVCTGDFREYMCANMLQGIDKVFKKLKLDMLVYSCGDLDRTSLESMVKRMVDEKRIGGIIGFSNFFLENNFPLSNILKETPIVIMDCRSDKNVDAFIRSDDKTGMLAIVDKLSEKGHKDVLYLSSSPKHCTGEYRLQAFLKRAEEKGINVTVIENVMNEDNGYLQAMRAFVEKKGFSAISCWTDGVAKGVMNFLKSQNIKIPSDVAVTGYGNLDFSSLFEPGLTTVEQNFFEIGEKAAELLLNAKNKRTYLTPVIYETKTELIVRESL